MLSGIYKGFRLFAFIQAIASIATPVLAVQSPEPARVFLQRFASFMS